MDTDSGPVHGVSFTSDEGHDSKGLPNLFQGEEILVGGAIVPSIERKSRYLLIRKMDDLKSPTAAKAVEIMLAPFVRHSVTFDNGSEFAKHERITKRLECPCYFATAGHPGQRGTLEQSNGLIRRIQPKKTTRYKWMRHEEVRHVQNLINGRRRKSLAGKRPKDYLSELLRPAPSKEAPAGASLEALGS